MGAALLVLLLFFLINALGKKNVSSAPLNRKEHIVEITEVKMFKEKPKEPEKPKETMKPVEKTATQKFTSDIKIKPDNLVKETLPTVDDLTNKVISDKTQIGKIDDGIPKEKPVEAGNGNTTVIPEIQPDFHANERVIK